MSSRQRTAWHRRAVAVTAAAAVVALALAPTVAVQHGATAAPAAPAGSPTASDRLLAAPVDRHADSDGRPATAPESAPVPEPNPTPAPAPAPGVSPTGVAGSWVTTFDDEFNGASLDRSRWSPDWYVDGGVQNRVATHPSNVAVTGGNLVLTLAGPNSGASVNTDPGDVSGAGFTLPVGGYVEARIRFPGNGTIIDNWPAWWASPPTPTGIRPPVSTTSPRGGGR